MNKNESTELHKKLIKKENEYCFLEDKEIYYHSIVIMELFNLEDFNNLLKGLKDIYADLNVLDFDIINKLEKKLNNQNSKLFNQWYMNLPFIADVKLKGKVLPSGVLHDLGKNIDFLSIRIYGTSPSTVIVQIHADLNSKVSEQLNGILHKYHEEVVEIHETPRGKYKEHFLPINLKKREINDLRYSIKIEVINFLKNYFKGFFFNLVEEEGKLVPSVDLFSLNYSSDNDELLNWLNKHTYFFECFSVSSYDPFKCGNYILFEEDSNYKNYLMFADRETANIELYDTVDGSIIDTPKDYSFEIFVIYRWVEIQEKIVGAFNSLITSEILNLENGELKKIIINRKRIYHEMFSFERFKAELESYSLNYNFMNFISIRHGFYLSKSLSETINIKLEKIEGLTKTFDKYFNSILNLKNVEYSKKSQDHVVFLTALVIFLTVILVLGSLNDIWSLLKFFANL